MPKTKDGFALHGFDFDIFLQSKLKECGLSDTALKTLDADINDFADMHRARKSYVRLDEELKTFRKKIIRHLDRLRRYQMTLTKDVARLDDDEYWFSFYKPRSKRIADLSEQYTSIARKLIETEEIISGIIYNLDQYQRGYYTKIFAKRLREARKAAGLTQAELAEQIGLKRSSYGLYEQARNEPNVSLLAILSQELNRSPNWLLGLTP